MSIPSEFDGADQRIGTRNLTPASLATANVKRRRDSPGAGLTLAGALRPPI
jgi:hypothetical protein